MVWDRPKVGTAGKNAFETICGILTRRGRSSAVAPAAAPPQTSPKATAKKAPAKKKTTGT